ncbi:MAG: efflux RND transporter permease subunit [Halieaceae bacterium]|jgi:multidrug efflux pump subunit AcrB|nr:efflux RND transporter permease subunit [Halieaceae bacterium]
MFERVIRSGILTTVVTLIVCVMGIVAALRIPVQMIPDLDVRVISVRTNWPGATPQDVEKEILIEQEDYLRNLPNLTRIIATATTGSAEIELEFPLGTDITEMMIRVSNALSQVPSYPEDVDEPQIFASSFSSNGFIFFSVRPVDGNPRGIDMDLTLDYLLDNVRPQLASVPGVSEIQLIGGSRRQIQIMIDPARLAQRGLTLPEVRNVIRSRNRDRSGGDVEDGKRQYLLRTVGRFEDLESLRQLILSRRGDQIIRLSDVADVQLDHFETRSEARYNGSPHIMVAVRREAGSNVIDIKNRMMPIAEELNRGVLAAEGLQMTLQSDDVRYVEASVANVWKNLAIGATLATLIMYLFLRSASATFIGVLGIPICVIVAFLGLLVAGRTINVISLAGIAFALGMTLDNSIVVLENIELKRRQGMKAFDAALKGVTEVWPAVFASTMTTVLVFLPVAFVAEEAGQLYSDIAIAVSSAIIASMLVAVTLIPTAAARMNIAGAQAAVGGTRAADLVLAFADLLIARPGRRLATIAIAMLVSIAIIAFLTPAAEYLPEGEEPKVFAAMSAPPGYNLDTMRGVADEIQQRLDPEIMADPERFESGQTSIPPVKYAAMFINTGGMRVILEPLEVRHMEALMDGMEAMIREFPGMRAFASRGSIISGNEGGSRSINLDISGPDLASIYRVAQAAERRAAEVLGNPRIGSQPSALSLAQPLIQLRPNWEQAASLGISAENLGFTVAALTDGAYVDEFFFGDDKIDVYLYSASGRDLVLDRLAQVPIYTGSGDVVSLGSLVELEESVDTSAIRRVGGRRTVTLNVIPPRSIALETGVGIVQRDVIAYLRETGAVPQDVSITITGAADQLDATRESLVGNYAVALLIVYLLMVAIFTHWGYPLLIMVTIPVGVAGGIVGLALLNGVGGLLPLLGLGAISQPFDMISMLGFLILMGTVVNNPILVVDRALQNVEEGQSPIDAVREALRTRLRPIAMSTMTTLFGLAPLVVIPGAGSELYRGVGAIVMFGILGAMLVTLTMLPALTVVALELRSRWRFRLAGSAS